MPTTCSLGDDHGGATWRDALRPIHRHNEGARELPIGWRSSGIAVVREDGAGAAFVSEQIAVDPRGTGDQAVGRGTFDQLVQLPARALRRDRIPAVLHNEPGSTRSARF